ncbi:E3 ubiquitin/ISG15 ligase TRIM25 isoform X6 [Oncorhynchus mykiss]|uniref:E3 ubiquitin/ISG15 ligase TRIM25 isoform X6 n=1 Tax=Oncorhynchus mykiss TaxID=8022 RepID=UPI001877CBDE|nr:E3 ubiquitin/ISG15 ligase TRIM25 isoform X6 [Oncorhynchus mykiss]
MAEANISVTESQFRCPICLDILKDPVSIPCGHTYCMACMTCYWDQTDLGHYSCPQCREEFIPRPMLRRNTVLQEVVDKLKLNELATAPELYLGGVGDVPCDFCPVQNKLKALKSCLVCLASFCELHILPHRDVGTLRRQKLVAAVESLAERLCAQHRLGLEHGGGDGGDAVEWSGDCMLCESDQEELHSIDEQRARKQASAALVLEDSNTLFVDLALRLERTRGEVRARLEARERTVLGRAERELETLENELEELRRRDKEMGQLLTRDNAQFLQEAPLLCVLPPTGWRPRAPLILPAEGFSAARRALSHLRARMEELCREEVDKISHAGGGMNESSSACHMSGGECLKVAVPASFPLSPLSLQPSDQRMRVSFLRCSCRLSLDPDTAHPTLFLLEGPQGAHCGEEPQSYPLHPLRFDSVAQVLCREGQFGGASYWEVEWRGGGWVDIGVTYKGIGRKGGGKPCLLGRNENSWRLRCTHAGYAAWHDNRKTTVAAPLCPRIGVFLEHQKGALSFYSVASDGVSLLHAFRCPFSQPLYPAFRLDLDSTLLICPHETHNGN